MDFSLATFGIFILQQILSPFILPDKK